MKKFILFTLTIIMITNSENLFSQNTNDHIKNIRKYFATIEAQISKNNYRKEIIEFEEDDRYGEITYYFDKDTLKKIIYNVIINEENNQKTSYYINNSKLFFVFHESTAPRIISQTKTEYNYSEQRFYYHDNKAIRCLLKEYIRNSDSKESKEKISGNTPNRETDCSMSKKYLDKYEEFKKSFNNM